MVEIGESLFFSLTRPPTPLHPPLGEAKLEKGPQLGLRDTSIPFLDSGFLIIFERKHENTHFPLFLDGVES